MIGLYAQLKPRREIPLRAESRPECQPSSAASRGSPATVMFTHTVTLSTLNKPSTPARNYLSHACMRWYEDLDDGVGDRRAGLVDNAVSEFGEHLLITTHIARDKVE